MNVAFKIDGWVKFYHIDPMLLLRDYVQIALEPPINKLVSDGGAKPANATYTVVTLHATGKTINNLPLYEFIN